MPTATKTTLNLYRGDTYEERIEYQDSASVPIPLTDYTARMHFRTTVDAETTILELTDVSGLTIDESSGFIDIVITDVQTALFATLNLAYYDLEITSPGGVVTTILHGSVSIAHDVSRT